MTEVRIESQPEPAERVAAMVYLGRRASAGLPRNLLSLAQLVGIVCAVAVSPFLEVTTPAAMLTAIAALIGRDLTHHAAAWVSRRRITAQFAASHRFRPVPQFRLTEAGLWIEGSQMPWAAISGVSHVKGLTLIDISPSEALILRDSDLPAGMTAESLALQIAAWRQV